MYPKKINDLIYYFQKFPGVGPKSAERMAFCLLSNFTNDEINSFSKSLFNLKEEIKKCSICNNISDSNICPICSDQKRDKTTIMIVKDPKDVFCIDSTNKYNGEYHVLNGLIDYSKAIGIDNIDFSNLLERIKVNEINEIIIALDTTLNGEITASYIKKSINSINDKINITRLSYGLPVGIDLKYVDPNTLLVSLEKRTKY